MKPRTLRAVGLAAGLAVTVGLVSAPPSAAVRRSTSDPQFEQISPASAPGSRPVAAHRVPVKAGAGSAGTVAGKAKLSSSEQVLQSFKGLQGVGSSGMAVAAGPKKVVQLGGQAVRIFTKATGAVTNKTINQLFGLPATITLTEPTIVYDPLGKRWVLGAIASDDGDDRKIALRVSKGTSPGKWFPAVYYGSTAGDGADIAEWTPRIGTSSNKVAVTAIASHPGDPTVANRILVLPKKGSSGLYADGKANAWSALVNSTYDGQLPAVNASKQSNLFIGVPDTNDVTVTTYSGPATSAPPSFSKSVTYPATALLPAPMVSQGGGDTLDPGPLAFSGAAWRNGRFWGAAATDCSGRACARVFGIKTSAGAVLFADRTLNPSGRDLLGPSLAVDRGDKLHVAVTDVGTATGPSLSVFVRRSDGSWTGSRLVRGGRAVVDVPPPGGTSSWDVPTSAAVDPTSGWDVWVAGAVGATSVPGGMSSRVARVSLAKNVATVKASRTRVPAGTQVTFTVKLHRPNSEDVIKGLPVALQTKPVHGGSWQTLRSGKTSKSGTAKWTLRVNRTALFRTLGKSVAQQGSPADGRLVRKVTSSSLRVTVT